MLEHIEGILHIDEGTRLYNLAKEVRGNIVEIGSYRGKSTCHLAEGSKAGHGAKIYAVDLWDLGTYDPRYNSQETYRKFNQNIKPYGDLVTPIRGNSLDVAKTWTKDIELLFIDGRHDYDSVKADYQAWSKFATKYVVFHDYLPLHYPTIEGVHKFVDETLGEPLYRDYSMVTFKII